MFAGHLRDDHVEVTVQRLKRRQSELQVQADHFGDHVANAREQLSANIFDFFRPQAANFFDERERQRKCRRPATHEERLRDNQRQRHLYGETRAVPQFRSNFNFAIQRVQVGAHHVESYAAARQFGHRSGR